MQLNNKDDLDIPWIDIAHLRENQVIVDKEENRYIGHPTSIMLEDKNVIIAVYPLGHGRGKIIMKKSYDGGLTWSDRLPVPKSWYTSLEVPTIYKVMTPEGKRRLLLFSGLKPIRMAYSDDDGDNWSELEPIFKYGGIAAMGTLFPLEEPGTYMAMFHDDGRFYDPKVIEERHQIYRLTCGDKEEVVCYISTSTDNGTTWGEPVLDKRTSLKGDYDWSEPELLYETAYGTYGDHIHHSIVYSTITRDGGLTWEEPQIACAEQDRFLCEPGAILSPDNKQIAILLREETRCFNSCAIFSNDFGATWSKSVEMPLAYSGDRHTLKYTKDGRIVATFRDFNSKSPTHGDWVAWVGTYDDIMNQRPGQYRIRL
ncbi:MAG: sialidase family protein, partial [Eubacteriales bacterium]